MSQSVAMWVALAAAAVWAANAWFAQRLARRKAADLARVNWLLSAVILREASGVMPAWQSLTRAELLAVAGTTLKVDAKEFPAGVPATDPLTPLDYSQKRRLRYGFPY